MLGLFAKKEVLFEFTLEHYKSKEMVYHSIGDHNNSYLAFPYYLDKLVYNVGEKLGWALWQQLGQRAWEGYNMLKAGGEAEDAKHPAQTDWQIVASPPDGERLVASAKLCEKNDHIVSTGMIFDRIIGIELDTPSLG